MLINSIDIGKSILTKHFIAQQIIAKNSKNESDLEWVKIKFSHSIDVFNICGKIIENDTELKYLSEQDKLNGKLAALLHDIGRFYEIGEQKLNGVPHGVYGAENILKKTENIKDEAIILPVKYHDDLLGKEKTLEELSKSNLSQNKKDNILKLLKLVMDSDKLANFYLFKEHCKECFLSLPVEITISEKCFKSFQDRCLVKRTDRKSVLDQLLFYIAWSYDLNYSFSKNLVKNEQYLQSFIETMLNYVKKESKNQNEEKEALSKIESIKNQLLNDGLL